MGQNLANVAKVEVTFMYLGALGPEMIKIVHECTSGPKFSLWVPGMQVRIRMNSLELEFALNSQDFVDPSEFEFTPSNSNSLRISLNRPHRVNP